jgi:PRC-barrel domain
MNELAGWIAPAATMIAAMMTAANLGARVTGWGFVVFTLGAVAWSLVAITTHQSNLLWSNAFLGVVDVIGIWRWLGRKAKLDDGARHAQRSSTVRAAPSLFPVSLLDGAELRSANGSVLGRCLGGMAETRSGQLSYLVVREGGLADVSGRHLAVPWDWVECADGAFHLGRDRDLARLSAIDPARWPARAPEPGE